MRSTSRRGNVALTAVLLGTLIGFSALAVDIGLARVARTQLQTALDAAALSGAQQLNGTVAGFALAEATAIEYGAYNAVLRSGVSLTGADVDVGVYESATDTFTPWDGASDPVAVNAVRVLHTAPTVAPVLSRVAFGANPFEVEASSVAQRPLQAGPAASTNCFLPFAIPDCHLAGLPQGQNHEPFKFTFAPTPTDSVAWGDTTANPSSTEVRDQLKGPCESGEAEVGQPMYVNEGSHTSALHTLDQILNHQTSVETTPWNASQYGAMPARDGADANKPGQSAVSAANWGTTLQGVVALVDGGANCDAVNFPGEFAITGFAWAVVYDVRNQGTNKNVYMLLDTSSEHDIWGDVADPDSVEGTDNVLAPGEPRLGAL